MAQAPRTSAAQMPVTWDGLACRAKRLTMPRPVMCAPPRSLPRARPACRRGTRWRTRAERLVAGHGGGDRRGPLLVRAGQQGMHGRAGSLEPPEAPDVEAEQPAPGVGEEEDGCPRHRLELERLPQRIGRPRHRERAEAPRRIRV